MRSPFLLALATAGGCLMLAAPASARQIFVSHVGFTDGAALVTVSDFDGAGPFAGGTFNAGRFALTANPGNAIDPGNTSVFGAWCVDVFRTISTGPVSIVYALGALSNDAALPAPNALSAAQISRITGLALHGDAVLAAPGNQTAQSAAIQAAMWKTLYPTATVSSADPAVQAIITSLFGMTFNATGGAVLQNFNDQGQLVVQTLFGEPPGGDPFEVPAPAALGLFGLALAGLLAARRARA